MPPLIIYYDANPKLIHEISDVVEYKFIDGAAYTHALNRGLEVPKCYTKTVKNFTLRFYPPVGGEQGRPHYMKMRGPDNSTIEFHDRHGTVYQHTTDASGNEKKEVIDYSDFMDLLRDLYVTHPTLIEGPHIRFLDELRFYASASYYRRSIRARTAAALPA